MIGAQASLQENGLDSEPQSMEHGIAEDRRLVLRARQGDRSAFGRLAEKYAGVVRALVRARLGPGADAEDAVQDVFLRAFRRLDTLDEPERFAGWISRIAVNKAVETIRTAKRRRMESLAVHPVDPPGPPEPDRLETEDELERMRRHVGDLDEKTQTVLALRFRAGMAVKDIAEQLGDKPPAVAMRISRALRRLRDSMGREGGEA